MRLAFLHESWRALQGFGAPWLILSYGSLFVATMSVTLLELCSVTRVRRLRLTIALVGLVLAVLLAALQWLTGQSWQISVFQMDRYSSFLALLIVAISLLTLGQTSIPKDAGQADTYSLPLLSTLGVLAVIHSTDLVGVYLGLELAMLPSLVWLVGTRGQRYSAELMTKLYVTASVSSLLLLTGLVLIYHATAQTSLMNIFAVASTGEVTSLKELGVILFVAGVACKMMCFPFHLVQADIYDAGQTTAVGFHSLVKVLIGAVILSRLLTLGWSPSHLSWSQLLGVAALLSALVGPLQALQQSHLKRRLAYNSLGHLGFLLLGFAAVSGSVGIESRAVTATLFYLVSYAVMTLGVFAVIGVLANRNSRFGEISDYAGLATKQPWLAVGLSVFWLGLAGVPLSMGFVSRFYILRAAADAELTIYVAVLTLTWVLALYEALQLVAQLFFKPSRASSSIAHIGYRLVTVIGLCALLTIYWGVRPVSLLQVIQESVRALLF